MALFSKRLKDPVDGTARVITSGLASNGGGYQRCSLDLMVEADGIPAHLVHVTPWIDSGKWPAENQTLPVLVDRADPQRIRIRFDQIPSLEEKLNARHAQRLADAQRAPTGGPAAAGPAPVAPPGAVPQAAPGAGSAADVLAHGSTCRVVIDAAQDLTMQTPAGIPMVAFTFTVTVDGVAPYQVQAGNPVPPEHHALVFTGSNLPAKVLADNPNAVVVDWAAAAAERDHH